MKVRDTSGKELKVLAFIDTPRGPTAIVQAGDNRLYQRHISDLLVIEQEEHDGQPKSVGSSRKRSFKDNNE